MIRWTNYGVPRKTTHCEPFRWADYTVHKYIYWLTNEWMNEWISRSICESVSQIMLVCTSLLFGWDRCSWFVLPFCANFFFYGVAAQVCHGILIREDSESQTDTPHSVALLWTRDRPVAETCLKTNNNHNRHPCLRWDSNTQSQQTSGCRPKPYTARPLGPAFLRSYADVSTSEHTVKPN